MRYRGLEFLRPATLHAKPCLEFVIIIYPALPTSYDLQSFDVEHQAPMPRGWEHDEGVPDITFLQSSVLLIFQQVSVGTAMSTQPGRDHISSSAPSLDGKGGTDSAAIIGKSTERTGPGYGVPYFENSTAGFSGLIYPCSILPSIYQTRSI